MVGEESAFRTESRNVELYSTIAIEFIDTTSRPGLLILSVRPLLQQHCFIKLNYLCVSCSMV
jgi:hypothetical protein